MLFFKRNKVKTILIVGILCSSLLFSISVNAMGTAQISINADSYNGATTIVTRTFNLGVIYPVETLQYTTDPGSDPLVGADYSYSYIVDIPLELLVGGKTGVVDENNVYGGYINGNYATTYSCTFTVNGSYKSNTLRVKLLDSEFNNNENICTGFTSYDSNSTAAISFGFKTSFFNFYKADSTTATDYELGTIKIQIQYSGANDGQHYINFGATTLVNAENHVYASPFANSESAIAGQVIAAIDASGSIDEIASILYAISSNTYLLNTVLSYLQTTNYDLALIINKLEDQISKLSRIQSIDSDTYVKLSALYDIIYYYIYQMNTEDTEAQSELQEAQEEMSQAAQDLDIAKPSLGMIFDNADTIFNEDLTTAQGTIMQFLTFQPIFSILLICFTIAIISYIIYGKSG